MCLAIFSQKENKFPGELLVRIEMITPSIKENHDIASHYYKQREHAIDSEHCLIEIDYLHFRTDGTKPYCITITSQNKTSTLYFGVADPIPIIQIQLNEPDVIELNLGKIYNHTLSNSRLFCNVIIDYEQEPIHMESFSPADQQAIRDKLQQIAQEHA